MMSSETFHRKSCDRGGGIRDGSKIIRRNNYAAYRNADSSSSNDDDDSGSTIGQILGQTNSRSFNNDNDDYDSYDDDGDGKASGDNHSILSSDFSSFSVSPLLEEQSDSNEQSGNFNSYSDTKTCTKEKKKTRKRSQEGTVDQILSSLLGKAGIDQPFDSMTMSKSMSSTHHNYGDNDDKVYCGPVDLDEIVDNLVNKKNDLYTGPVDLDDLADDMMFVDPTSTVDEELVDGRGSRCTGDVSVNEDLYEDDSSDDDDYRGPVDIDELFEGDQSSHDYADGPIHHEIVTEPTMNDECKKPFILTAKKAKVSTTEDPNDREVADDEEKVGTNDDTHDEIKDEEETDEVGKVSDTKDKDSLDHVQSLIAMNHSYDIADDVMDYLHSLIDRKKNKKKIACDRVLETVKSQSIESHLRSTDEDGTMKNRSIPRTVHILSPTITTDSSSSSSSQSHSTPTYSPPRLTNARPAPPSQSRQLSGPVDLDTTLELDIEFDSILDMFEVQQWKSRDDNAELRNPFHDYEIDDDDDDDDEKKKKKKKTKTKYSPMNERNFEKEKEPNRRGIEKM